MANCIHDYKYLEGGKNTSGKRVWIFYCTKCLDLREVLKNPTFKYNSDQ